MKFYTALFLVLSAALFSQTLVPLDTLRLRDTEDIMVDDYGSVYLYRNKNFSLKKYSLRSSEAGSLMFTVPYKVQSVRNPLNIPLFSENAQELRFVDHNLNNIQTIDLKSFGFIKMAFAEDHQQIWLLEESTRRLLKYNFREQKILSSYPFHSELADIRDLMVYEDKVYMLYPDKFAVQDLSGNILFSQELRRGVRLRRENSNVQIVSKNKIYQYAAGGNLKKIFEVPGARIVDKNSTAYFAVVGNMLYLYGL